jgi:cyclase
MNSKRLIVSLQLWGGKCIKTSKFEKNNSTYLGDVLNAVNIYNEKEVDELVLFDLEASKNRIINFELLSKISRVSRMPLTYGGGIDSLEKATKLLSLGIEKLNFNNLFFNEVDEFKKISNYIGKQSIVLSIDYRKEKNNYNIYYEGGAKKSALTIRDIADKNIQQFVGELYLNNIERDGEMNGYDDSLLKNIYNDFKIPITVSGGFNNYENIKSIFSKYNIIGISCSSLFVFKGRKKAVLLSYPDKIEKEYLKQSGIK